VISIVVPTVRGREHHLDRCLDSYERHTDDFELIVVRDQPNWGTAIREGALQAGGDYLHFTADDIEPHQGWWQAAIETVKAGFLPAPLILNPDGSVQSCGDQWAKTVADGTVCGLSRVPFMSRAQERLVGPMIPVHHWADDWVSHRGRLNGIQTVVSLGYRLTHHQISGPNPGDHNTYLKYVSGELVP
jgi:glycosyltransferase involved in cell wall biosynthesis